MITLELLLNGSFIGVPLTMFPRNSILIDKETGAQYRVLATPDISALVVEPGVRVPCYGLQDWAIPSDPYAKVSYLAQSVVEDGQLVARDGCPP